MDQAMVNSEERREAVLAGYFGQLYAWQPPELENAVGPFDPEPFQMFDRRRLAVLEDARKRLNEFNDDQIAGLLDQSSGTADEATASWVSDLRGAVNKLLSARPPWYAGGFGHPGYRADFEQWSKMAKFTIVELLNLSVGIEPSNFVERDMVQLRKDEGRPNLRLPLVFLLRRYDQLQRRFARYTVSPVEFLEWRDQVSFDTHPEFLRYLRLYHARPTQPPLATSAAASNPDKREIDKVAQLLVSMAIDGYGYDPGAARSPIPKEITDNAAKLGISISDDTVRKYLKLGASFLPDGWKAG